VIKPENGAIDYSQQDLATLDRILKSGDDKPIEATAEAYYRMAAQLRRLVLGVGPDEGGPETMDGILKALKTWQGPAATEFLAQAQIVRDYGVGVLQRAYDQGVEASKEGIGFTMHTQTQSIGIALSTAKFQYTQLQKTRDQWATRIANRAADLRGQMGSGPNNRYGQWVIVDTDYDYGVTAGFFIGGMDSHGNPAPGTLNLYHYPGGTQDSIDTFIQGFPEINQSVVSTVGSDSSFIADASGGLDANALAQAMKDQFAEPYRQAVADAVQWLANAYAWTKFPDHVDTSALPAGAGQPGSYNPGAFNTSGPPTFGPPPGPDLTHSPPDPSKLGPDAANFANSKLAGLPTAGGFPTSGLGSGLDGLGSGSGLGTGALGDGGLGGGAGASTGAGAGLDAAALAGRGMPMMPLQPGAGGGKDGASRQRTSWLPEEEDVWGANTDVAPPVL
jgi:hypothetical protein